MAAHTIPVKRNTVTSVKLIPKQHIRIKLRILRIQLIPKTINPHEITDVTDVADFIETRAGSWSVDRGARV